MGSMVRKAIKKYFLCKISLLSLFLYEKNSKWSYNSNTKDSERDLYKDKDPEQ